MKKNIFVKFAIAFLVAVLLSSYLMVFAVGATETIENLIVANKVSSLSDDATVISYDAFIKQKNSVEDGLTIICGENIDVSILEEKIFGENKKMKDAGKVAKQEVDLEEFGEAEEEYVYLFMCFREDEYIGIYTEGISCSKDVKDENKKDAIESLMGSANVEKAKNNFIWNQVEIKPNLFAGRMVYGESRTAGSAVYSNNYVRRVMRNITPGGQSTEYSIVLYKTDVNVCAYYEGAEEDSQIYTIYVDSTVIHATDPDAYEGVSGVYNAQYGNNVIICGASISFVNDFPQYDEYINMAPARIDDDINGEAISFGLFGHSATMLINLPDAMGNISLSNSFEPYGTSSVEIRAAAGWNNLYSMSTGSFTIKAMANIRSGGEVLSTSFKPRVLYSYQYAPGTRTWSYYTWDILHDSSAA